MKKLLLSTFILACLVSCQKTEMQSDSGIVAPNAGGIATIRHFTCGEGTVTQTPATAQMGQPITLTATPGNNYVFDHWSREYTLASMTPTFTDTPDVSDVNYTAVFRPAFPGAVQGISTLTFHNLVPDSQFRNECEIQYVGPDGNEYSCRISPGFGGSTLRFPVLNGSRRVTVYIQLESTADPLYYCVATYYPFDPSSSDRGYLDLSLRGQETSSLIYLDYGDQISEDMTVTLRAEMYDFRSGNVIPNKKPL